MPSNTLHDDALALRQDALTLGIPYNIAVVDVGAHLIGFVRQDGAILRQDHVVSRIVIAVRETAFRHSGQQCREGGDFRRRHSFGSQREHDWRRGR